MKEIRKAISKRLPPLRIYWEEIKELYLFLSGICEGSVVIQTWGYSLDSIDEIMNLTQEQTNSISFICNHPYLRVILTKHYGEIYCDDAGLETEGIVSRIQRILLKGKVTRLSEHVWLLNMLGLALGTPFLLGVLINNVPVIAFGGLLFLGFLTFLTWDYHLETNSFCTIVFKSRKEALGFWKRNKDQVFVLLIGALIGQGVIWFMGALIGAVISFLNK